MLPQRALSITQKLREFIMYGTRRSYLALVGGLYRGAVQAVNIGEDSRDGHFFTYTVNILTQTSQCSVISLNLMPGRLCHSSGFKVLGFLIRLWSC